MPLWRKMCVRCTWWQVLSSTFIQFRLDCLFSINTHFLFDFSFYSLSFIMPMHNLQSPYAPFAGVHDGERTMNGKNSLFKLHFTLVNCLHSCVSVYVCVYSTPAIGRSIMSIVHCSLKTRETLDVCIVSCSSPNTPSLIDVTCSWPLKQYI